MHMKIIKTIALASLILVSSRFVSCFNPDEPSRKSFIEIVINGVIENIVKAEQDLGENVDSIFIVCNNPQLSKTFELKKVAPHNHVIVSSR